MLIVSPHLDDAVFSCGELIAGVPDVTVVTVCAGIPGPQVQPSQFDTAAGFRSAAEAMRARRAEDERAAEILGFDVVHLDCLSDEYDRAKPGRADRVMSTTREALSIAEGPVLAPLGLRHPDHELVAGVCRRLPRVPTLYAELPYRVLWPEYLPAALERSQPVMPSAHTPSPVARTRKAAAIRCYESQIIGMTMPALEADEQFYRVIP